MMESMQCSGPWTTLVWIVSVCTVSVCIFMRTEEETRKASGRPIMPRMHHQLAAAPRGCFHEKPTCRFHLTPRRLQPTACPHTIRQFLSLYTSEAISLSLSLSLPPPFFIPSLSPSDEREGSADWRLAVCASTLPSVEVRQSHS